MYYTFSVSIYHMLKFLFYLSTLAITAEQLFTYFAANSNSNFVNYQVTRQVGQLPAENLE